MSSNGTPATLVRTAFLIATLKYSDANGVGGAADRDAAISFLFRDGQPVHR